MTQVIVHALRNADLAALDQSGSDIHAITEDVAFFEHDVADIDANPEEHPSPVRLTIVRTCKRLLDLDRAMNRVKHAREFRKHAISRGVRDPASMPPNQVVDECTTGGQRRHCCFFVAVH